MNVFECGHFQLACYHVYRAVPTVPRTIPPLTADRTYSDLGNNAFTNLDPRTNDRRAFNSSAFAVANCGTNFQNCGGVGRRGTSSRNLFRLDNPINNWDMALIKKTKLWGESSNLELRFEAFNLLNKAQFTTVDLNLNSTNFGRFTDTRESRSIQVGARINF